MFPKWFINELRVEYFDVADETAAGAKTYAKTYVLALLPLIEAGPTCIFHASVETNFLLSTVIDRHDRSIHAMLRDLPPFHSNESAFMSTPAVEEVSHQNDLLDDIFGSAPSSPILDHPDGETVQSFVAQANERSDIQRLRITHVTNGYREGIADSKEKFIQAGFDEGYSLGAELGVRVGWCLGVLEGICRALPAEGMSAMDTMPSSHPVLLVKRARDELKMQNLLTEKYFGVDGIWLYDVPGQESETTFREVAAAHPMLKMWIDTVHLTLRSYGLAAGSAVD
ncbi:Essential protein Yae1, N terminal [Oleoguttula sp. CCFEE 5521]